MALNGLTLMAKTLNTQIGGVALLKQLYIAFPIIITGALNGSGWYNYAGNGYSFYFLIEFAPVDAPVVFNQTFCDSIDLKSTPIKTADTQGFSEITMTDAAGVTITELQNFTFTADAEVTLHGTFMRSDGQTCEMTSSPYSFDVEASPTLLVTNYNGTSDLLGGDTIVLYASADVGTISWIDYFRYRV